MSSPRKGNVKDDAVGMCVHYKRSVPAEQETLVKTPNIFQGSFPELNNSTENVISSSKSKLDDMYEKVGI